MPANIAKINGRDAVAYLGSTPWHRLGTKMEGEPNVEDALRAAALDWTVDLEPLYLDRVPKRAIPKKFAVVRNVDDAVLGVVGKNYTPLQNSEAFGVLNEACQQFQVVIETAGALGRGDVVWMLARMPEIIEPVPGDRVEGYFLVTSGHNGYTPYVAKLTPTRVVCANTLEVALRGKTTSVVKLKHVRTDVEQLELATTLVSNLVGALKATGESFSQLAARQLSSTELDDYIDTVLGIKDRDQLTGVALRRRERIKQLTTEGRGSYFAPGSAWSAYNAFTEYIDHVRVGKAPRTLRQADKSATFGPLSRLKASALQRALALV